MRIISSLALLVGILFASESTNASAQQAQTLQADSAQTTKPGNAAKPQTGTELPEAPQPAPVTSGGPLFPARPPPGAQTLHDKFMAFAVGTVGPRALVSPAIPAAFRMASPPSRYPREWRDGAEAFGRNYGDQLATVSALQVTRFTTGALLHEDLRYHPSSNKNPLVRTVHAIIFTFVDESDTGHPRLALANFAGVGAGSYVGKLYLPTGFNDTTHADQRFAVRMGGMAISNISQEFAPEVFKFFLKHHIPLPTIPVPEWWVRR